jgi:alpha-tubulin suppressor-like RCC1 family protein
VHRRGAASEGAQPHDAGVQSVEIALSDAVDAGALQAPNDSGVSTGGGSSGGASGSGAGSTGGSSTSGSSTGAASSYLNFAIVTQGAGATGACNAQGECFVPIENDPNEGWSVTGNTVTLAAGLCSQLNPQLGGQAQLFFVDNGTNQACQTKTDSQPVCEAAQLMGDGGASADDASREGPDTGVVMAADGGSSGMHMGGGPQDASAPITGGPDSSTSGGGSSGGTGFSGGDAGSSGTKDAGTSSAELTGVASLAAGPYTTCAVMQNGGTVDCWGLVLGNVTPTPEPMPGLSNVSTGALGGNMTNGFACALEGNAVLCEGSNSSGELGNGSNVDSNTPVAVTGITSSPTAVGAGAGFACALLSTGTVECWGDNVSGDLGNPDASTPSPNPVPVVNLTDATGLAVGSDFACALIAGGSVECWGDNTYGILGSDEAGTSSNVPVIVSGFGGEAVTSLAAGQNHVCALTAKGTIYCWGDNTYNQLGTGGGTEMQSYTPVIATPVGVTALAAGGNENCVIVQGAGQVACWGSDSDGQIGNGVAPGGTSEQITMTGVVNATAIVVGGDHACALVQNGSVECWGYNAAGEIGTGQSTPTTVLSPTFVVPAGNGGAGNDAAIEP